MTGLVTNLNALARALERGVVTPAEAATRLQVLAARVPTFVVWVEGLAGREPVLCYLSTARREQDALAEARRALGPEARGDALIRVTVACPGIAWRRDGPVGEQARG